jgi:hypothetical protein
MPSSTEKQCPVAVSDEGKNDFHSVRRLSKRSFENLVDGKLCFTGHAEGYFFVAVLERCGPNTGQDSEILDIMCTAHKFESFDESLAANGEKYILVGRSVGLVQ